MTQESGTMISSRHTNLETLGHQRISAPTEYFLFSSTRSYWGGMISSLSPHTIEKVGESSQLILNGNTSRIALGIAHFSTLGGKTSFHYTTMLLLRMFQSPKYLLWYIFGRLVCLLIFQNGSIGDQYTNSSFDIADRIPHHSDWYFTDYF